MLKCELEKKLNKTLTNQEYTAYIMAEYKAKKYGKKMPEDTKKVNFTFMDAKEEFLNTLEKESDKNYYKKDIEYVLKINNYFLTFSKPRIETRFCFGYGQNGISSDDDFERAQNNMHNADTNEQYFLNENLEELNHNIEEIKILLMTEQERIKYCDKQYQKNHEHFYYMCEHLEKMILCKNYNNRAYIYNFYNHKNNDRLNYCEPIRELTKDELKSILAVYEQQKKNFEKRLQTYLKRYGLSKLHTWTYLVD